MRVFLREVFTGIGGPQAQPERLRAVAWVNLLAGIPLVLLPTAIGHARHAFAEGASATAQNRVILFFFLAGVIVLSSVGVIATSRRAPAAARWLTYLNMLGVIVATHVSNTAIGTLLSPASAFVVLMIAVYRVVFDYRLGLTTMLAACATYGFFAWGESSGFIARHPYFPDLEHPVYTDAQLASLVLQAVLASFVITFFTVNYGVNQSVKLHRYITESVLRRYLPPALVARAAKGELHWDGEPERRVCTIMFTDLVGFTQLSEKLGAEAVGRVLSKYLSAVAMTAHAHGATVDKFIGDAVMLVFGAPDSIPPAEQARRAIALARRIHELVPTVGGDIVLEARTGINTGEVIMGHFGSQERSEFTVIGPTVNVAARLEGRSQPGRILVGEETARLLGDAVKLEPAGEIYLRGVSRPVRASFVADVGQPAAEPQSDTPVPARVAGA